MPEPIPAGFRVIGREDQSAALPPGFRVVGQAHPGATQVGQAERDIVGAAEAALTVGTGTLGSLAGGLTGLATQAFTGNADAAVAVQDATQDAFTYRPRTEEGQQSLNTFSDIVAPVTEAVESIEQGVGDFVFEKTDTPFLAAVATAVPTAIGTLVAPPTAVGARSLFRASDDPVDQTVKQLRKQKAPDLDIDQEALEASQRLGIELGPESLSQNSAFVETAQALKSRPGSHLAQQENRAIQGLNDQATKLIDELGGNTDRLIFDESLRSDIHTSIADLQKRSDEKYAEVERAIAPRTEVTLHHSKQYIDELLEDLGGDKELFSRAERDLYRITQGRTVLTYASLDRLRRSIGEGFDRLGPYGNDSESRLRAVYGALSRDQARVADEMGVGETYKSAADLVAQRKALEDQSVKLFGRDLARSLVQQTGNAAAQLVKGDASGFRRLMSAIPKGRQGDAALAVLDQIFTQGSRNKDSVGAGFANAYRGLQRNTQLKNMLFRYLPKEARSRFDDLGQVANAIYRAKQFENKSRTANSILAALDEASTFEKLFKVSARVATFNTELGTLVSGMLSRSRVDAADELLVSPAFRAGIRKLGAGDEKAANRAVVRSGPYKKWAKKNPAKASQIKAIGFWAWLAGESNE